MVMSNYATTLAYQWNGLHNIKDLQIDYDRLDAINQFKWGF